MTTPRGSNDDATADAGMPASTGAGLDLSAAMVRAESHNLDAMLHALISRLESVPGLEMRVAYHQGKLRRLIGDLPYINDLHRSSDPVKEVVVTVGSRRYWLRSRQGSITCGTEASSIERREARDELSFSAWATALFGEISQQNLVNHGSLVALSRLVEQDRVS